MKGFIPLLVVGLALFLAACNPTGSLSATVTPITAPLPTATLAPTTAPQPTATQTPSPTPTQPAAVSTPTRTPLPVVYYYFASIEGNTFPAGSVVILKDELILSPALSGTPRSPDSSTNIASALMAMINDPRNEWKSSNLGITSISFDKGTANVALQGEILAPGGIVLVAARMQILMTVFAEASVQTAVVTLNGKSIANLGVSNIREVKPADYTYTRTGIETFMAENAYGKP